MLSVDRKNFITDFTKAYVDAPLLIAHDQTISAPHMVNTHNNTKQWNSSEHVIDCFWFIINIFQHALVLEAFLEKFGNGKRALDIGCGSGYLTTCLALALGEESIIVGIDCFPKLRDMAEHILKNNYLIYLKNKKIELVGMFEHLFTNLFTMHKFMSLKNIHLLKNHWNILK